MVQPTPQEPGQVGARAHDALVVAHAASGAAPLPFTDSARGKHAGAAEAAGQPARALRAPALRALAAKLGRVKWSNYLNLPTTCAFFGLATGCGACRRGLGASLALTLSREARHSQRCSHLCASPTTPCPCLVYLSRYTMLTDGAPLPEGKPSCRVRNLESIGFLSVRPSAARAQVHASGEGPAGGAMRITSQDGPCCWADGSARA